MENLEWFDYRGRPPRYLMEQQGETFQFVRPAIKGRWSTQAIQDLTRNSLPVDIMCCCYAEITYPIHRMSIMPKIRVGVLNQVYLAHSWDFTRDIGVEASASNDYNLQVSWQKDPQHITNLNLQNLYINTFEVEMIQDFNACLNWYWKRLVCQSDRLEVIRKHIQQSGFQVSGNLGLATALVEYLAIAPVSQDQEKDEDGDVILPDVEDDEDFQDS